VLGEEAYRSKIGVAHYTWIVFFLGLAVYLLYEYATLPEEFSGGWVALLLFLTIALLLSTVLLFIWLVFYRLKYVLTADCLLVQRFFSKDEIAYSSVKVIKEASDFNSYYMGFTNQSMDQVCIEYERVEQTKYRTKVVRDAVYISPVRKEEFLTKLSARCGIPYSEVGRESKEKKEMRLWMYLSLSAEALLAFAVVAAMYYYGSGGWVINGYLTAFTFNLILLVGLVFCNRVEKPENAAKLGKYKNILALLVLITFAAKVFLAVVLI